MKRRAHAKLNWYLEVLRKRTDGYHDLLMLNQRLSLFDELEFSAADELRLHVTGADEVPENGKNLVIQAAKLLKAETGVRLGADITLIKRIPSRAGLGGGSADAASTLLALNELWGLNIPRDRLALLALRLGADIPYCLFDSPAIVSGIGESVNCLQPLPSYWILLLKPDSSLSTGDMFNALRMDRTTKQGNIEGTLHALRDGNPQLLRQQSLNSLQNTAIHQIPVIGELMDALYKHGAAFAQMTGSGSCVYGVFRNQPLAQAAERELHKSAAFAALCATI